MLFKKVSKSVEAQTAAAVAVFLDFCRSQALDPVKDVERAVIAIGKDRMAVLDGNKLPDWVRFSLSIDVGSPISSDEVLAALKALRDEGLNSLIEAALACRQGHGRRLDRSLQLERYRQTFEPAFRDALSAVRSPFGH